MAAQPKEECLLRRRLSDPQRKSPKPLQEREFYTICRIPARSGENLRKCQCLIEISLAGALRGLWACRGSGPIQLDLGLVAHNVVAGDGQGRVMLELARACSAAGHDVTVYAHRFDAKAGSTVRFRRFPRVPGPQLIDDLALLSLGSRIVRRHDLVVVMGPVVLPRGPYAYYAEFSQAGWRATWTDRDRPDLYHRAHAWLGRRLERVVASKASGVVACSEPIKRQVSVAIARSRTPATDPVWTVIPNGIQLDEFEPVDASRRARARDALGMGPGDFALGFIGEYHTNRKGLDVLLDAVGQRPGDEVVIVAGSGPVETTARRARELGVHLRQLGVVPASNVLDASDVVVVPSRYEPFSLVALEAAASGLPLILGPAVGAGPYLDGAVVLRENSADELRSEIDGLRADPDRGTRCSTEARRSVERLRWENTTAEAVAFLEQLAERTRDP